MCTESSPRRVSIRPLGSSGAEGRLTHAKEPGTGFGRSSTNQVPTQESPRRPRLNGQASCMSRRFLVAAYAMRCFGLFSGSGKPPHARSFGPRGRAEGFPSM